MTISLMGATLSCSSFASSSAPPLSSGLATSVCCAWPVAAGAAAKPAPAARATDGARARLCGEPAARAVRAPVAPHFVFVAPSTAAFSPTSSGACCLPAFNRERTVRRHAPGGCDAQ